jgi:hypothetical protein
VSEAESIAADLVKADAAYPSLMARGPGAVDEVFGPRTGPICGWCDYRAHCSQGRAAAREKSGWAALEPD